MNDHSNDSTALVDIQNSSDVRNIPIDKVGVRGLRFPITVRDKQRSVQNTVATIGMFVDLPKEFKGTHMSRFIEVLNAHGNVIHVENIEDILFAMQQKFSAATSHLEIEFPYFMVKRAPVTRRESVMDYVARFDATACNREIDFARSVGNGSAGSLAVPGEAGSERVAGGQSDRPDDVGLQ